MVVGIEAREYNLLVEGKVDVERTVARMNVTLMSIHLRHTRAAMNCPVSIARIEGLHWRT
jgi:hypothetical protein